MATWEWPGGKRGEGRTEEDAWANYLLAHPEETGVKEVYQTPGHKEVEDAHGAFVDFALGGIQGVIDPIEGVGQLVEHLTGIKVAPDKIKKGLRDFRTSVQSTRAGQVGEIAGNIGGSLIPGMALTRGLRAAGYLAPTARLTANAFLPRFAAGSLEGVAQPVEGRPEDYGWTKANQFVGGGLTAGVLPAIAQKAANINVPSHFSWTHLIPSTIGHVIQPVGRFFSRTPASATGAVIGDVVEQERREPLRITVPVGDKVPSE